MAGPAASLTDSLIAIGLPYLERHERHPMVRTLVSGTLTEDIARAWLEQDYLYLLEEVRVLTRLAWQAPATHQPDLIDLAWAILHEEIPHHRVMAAAFEADLGHARMDRACRAYTTWILDAAADYGLGLVALFSGLWAYSTLGPRLALPKEPRFRVWVESYQAPAFAILAHRFGDMVNEVSIDENRAMDVFVAGLEHGIDFWDVGRAAGVEAVSAGRESSAHRDDRTDHADATSRPSERRRTMKSRQALLSRPNAPFDIVESDIPVLADGQILVRQELCGVCATDAHMWKGHLPGVVYPLVLGHETIGIIDAIGGNVPRVDCVGRPVDVGDRIYIVPGISCGVCYFCAALHEPTLCLNGTGTGFNPFPERPWLHGGWSEYVLIDHPRQTFVKIDGLEAQAALFLEPLAVGMHALDRVTVRAGDIVVIQGAGAVGMGALVAARESGAHRTIVIGAPATRLAMARELGADVTIDLEFLTGATDRIEQVRGLSSYGLGADLVVECTGFPASVPEGLEMLRRGGSYVVAGHFTDRGTIPINPYAHFNANHVTIRGSWGAEVSHFIQALPILASGRYDTGSIVSHRVPLVRVGDVCAALTSDYRLDGEEVRKVAIEASLR